MPTSHLSLNARQREVLGWIAAGCLSGVMEGETHKVSARALQRRGLVRVEGRSDKWRAVVTELGRRLLAEGTVEASTGAGPGRRPESTRNAGVVDSLSTLSQAEQLVAWVVAAGNRLEEKQVPSTVGRDLYRLVDSVNRFGKAPPGTRLALAFNGSSAILTLEDDPRAMRPMVDFVVPNRVGRLHPTAQAFKMDRDRQEVSDEQLPRAVRLIHALAREADRRGYQLQAAAAPQKFPYEIRRTLADGQLVMKISSHRFGLRLQEKSAPGGTRPLPHGRSSHSTPAWRQLRQTDFVPTGKLMLTIERGYPTSPGRSSIFSDGVRHTLEERLPWLLQELEVRALELAWVEEQRQREAETRQALWDAEVHQARLRLLEAHRADALNKQVTAWEQAQRIRRYVEALRIHISSLDDPDEAEVAQPWLRWAAKFAERTDPFGQPIGLPADPPVNLETLRPHLNWSGPPGALSL